MSDRSDVAPRPRGIDPRGPRFAAGITSVLLLIAAAGTLKDAFVATAADQQISASLTGIGINPLALGCLIAGIIRVSLGSATVAGIRPVGA